MGRRAVLWATAAIVSLSAAPSRAASPTPVESLRPSASAYSHVTTESSRVLPKWTPAAALLSVYGQDVAVATPGQLSLRRRTTSHLLVAFGMFDWTELSLGLPLVVHQEGTASAEQNAAAIQAAAVGDLRVGLKGTILRTPRRGFGLGLSFDLFTPTGDSGELAGTGTVGYAPQILLEQRMARGITAGVNLGYLARRDLNVGGIVFGDALTYRAALRIPLDRQRRLFAVGEMDGAIAMVRGARSPLSMRAGLRAQLRSGVLFGLYGGGAPVAALGIPEVEVMLSVGYAPPGRLRTELAFDGSPRPNAVALARRADRLNDADRAPATVAPRNPDDVDGDGILTQNDHCPRVAEDRDRFEDSDGCPDLDNDRDGIRDELDLCRSAPEVVNGYLDRDGCPDARLASGKGVTYERFDAARVLPRLAFAARTSTLDAKSLAALAQLAELLVLNPWMERLELAIFVQKSDDAAADRTLADARAQTIAAYLAAKGIKPERVGVAPAKAVPKGAREGVRLAVKRRGAARVLEPTRSPAPASKPGAKPGGVRYLADGPPGTGTGTGTEPTAPDKPKARGGVRPSGRRGR